MKRRSYLGVVGMAALSGCSALTGNNPTDDVGESYTTEGELELTVDQLETQAGGSITLGNGSEINSASSAVTFVIPHLVATNTTESALSVPAVDSFSVMSGGQRQDPYRVDYREIMDELQSSISEPVSGPLFPSTSEIGPEEEAEGWLVFTVPEAGETVVLELRLNDDVQFSWSLLV
jgi:hypothetical protein